MLEEIQGHIDGHPDQSDSDWDDILTGNISEKDQKNSRITGDLENIMLLHPDSNLSKAELLAYINKLDAESRNIAVQWIKNKIENFILNLKNHMQSGIVMDGDEYFSFLSDLQINVTLKYPLNEELQKSGHGNHLKWSSLPY